MRALALSISLTLVAAGHAHAQPEPEPAPVAEAPPGAAAASGGVAPAAAAAMAALPPPAIDEWDDEVSDFDKMRTPDSPAFVVLGVSPTEIQRPSTPRGLLAALGGALSGSNFGVPKNLALELAPYWLFSHPNVPIQDYRRNHLMRPIRTLSISLATNQTTRPAADADGTAITHVDSDIGIGARSTLFQTGEDDECTARSRAAIELATAALLSADELKQLEAVGSVGSAPYNAAYQATVVHKAEAYAAAQKVDLEKTAQLFNDKCVALAAAPTGFQLDLAGAVDVRAIGSKLTAEATSVAGYAIWANASYDWPSFSGVVMARFASHDTDAMTERVADAGARAIYKASEYVLSAEGIVRYRLDDARDRTTYKVDVGVEFEVTPDTWVAVSIGKDFAFTADHAGSLFSLANLKWSFTRSATAK